MGAQPAGRSGLHAEPGADRLSEVRERDAGAAGVGRAARHGAVAIPGEIVLDRCVRCGCTWFDGLELAHVFAFRKGTVDVEGLMPARHDKLCLRCGSELPWTAGESCPTCGASVHLRCPRCDRMLLVGTVAGVPVETCEVCMGILLDAGEITQLAAAYRFAPPGGHTCSRCKRSGFTSRQINDCGGGRLVCEFCFRDGQAEGAIREREQMNAEAKRLLGQWAESFERIFPDSRNL